MIIFVAYKSPVAGPGLQRATGDPSQWAVIDTLEWR